MYARPTAPRAIGGVLDDAIRLFRASFAQCWVLALIAAALTGAGGMYVTAQMGAIGGRLTVAGASAVLARLHAMEHSPGLWVVDLLIAVVALVMRAAIIRRQDAVANNRSESLGEAVIFGVRRLPTMVVAGIAWLLALMVGCALLIVPGIWLWGQLQLWLVALCAEDLGPFKTLGRSWQLIERNWWRTTTIVGVAFIIILVLQFSEGIVTGVAVVVFRGDTTTLLLVSQLLTVVVSVFTMPMLTVAMLAIYYDLKLRREGGDLAARVSSLQPA